MNKEQLRDLIQETIETRLSSRCCDDDEDVIIITDTLTNVIHAEGEQMSDKKSVVSDARRHLLQGKSLKDTMAKLEEDGVSEDHSALVVCIAERKNEFAKLLEQVTLEAVGMLDDGKEVEDIVLALMLIYGMDIGSKAVHQACLRRGLDPFLVPKD